ncbi:UDP-N-acetylmuramate dehydrogenase [Phaeocystidibacter marisrubri]|uniref:UDP-N-acetylenolpyruvoylglucosamine reductase n=1 Tax=Phaeocystidibacter marisrubri TaxID=1577780 RepID=A0A6L3ZHC4_9FLAO|nr:UDP-N-acetylmuramate dehydrogenase [Phaeocystidibacter marisrubri]KAB2817254.1 UDP-N-acetylmuramate dehydrogenase [Phaeocystidibacter marisrubri]GGH76230.1 UDP-N-acetylenolpyruvoylglucosamine reductase [Phaeocystidibacter marisrubri]
MRKYENPSLKNFNTFGLDERAREVWVLETEEDVVTFAKDEAALNRLQLILGGGSNLLLTGPINGLVAHIALKGREILSQDDKHVLLQVKAGESWHETVRWTVENNFGGLENLSLIPGQVGTAPVQNIGAYGVELKDHFHSLDGVVLGTGERKTFTAEECQFGYRDSIFKHEWKAKFIITAVRFKLTVNDHAIRTSYGAIHAQLDEWNIAQPTIDDVSKAVIAIRQSKLPNPAEIGNSGSFFKNPVVAITEYERVKAEYPDVVAYPAGEGRMKLAAGWLIDQSGWKGYRKGDAGVHIKQALVLVNYGNARGAEVWDLAQTIIKDVHERFGILLEPEVNIL